MALNSLFCADVPLSNYSLTHVTVTPCLWIPLSQTLYFCWDWTTIFSVC